MLSFEYFMSNGFVFTLNSIDGCPLTDDPQRESVLHVLTHDRKRLYVSCTVTIICLFWENKKNKVTSWISLWLSKKMTADGIRTQVRYNQKHTPVLKLRQSFNAEQR